MSYTALLYLRLLQVLSLSEHVFSLAEVKQNLPGVSLDYTKSKIVAMQAWGSQGAANARLPHGYYRHGRHDLAFEHRFRSLCNTTGVARHKKRIETDWVYFLQIEWTVDDTTLDQRLQASLMTVKKIMELVNVVSLGFNCQSSVDI